MRYSFTLFLSFIAFGGFAQNKLEPSGNAGIDTTIGTTDTKGYKLAVNGSGIFEVEELTLYIIDMKKEALKQQARIENLEKRVQL